MKSILSISLLAVSGLIFGQEVPADTLWKKSGTLVFSLQQAGFTNWANGGIPSLAYGSVLNYSANRADENSTWNNSFQGAFGFLKQDEGEARKNTDLLILTSEYGKNFSENTQIAVGTDIRSQFAKGYVYSEDPNTGNEIKDLVSAFLSPGYVQTYIGLSYKKSNFNATISPATNKLTFVLDETLSAAGSYGVDAGKKVRSQFGASLNAGYASEVAENVSLKTNLMLFGDYAAFTQWDVNYDLFLDFKINKFLSTNFLLQMIYDHDIRGNNEIEGENGPALQIRNVLNFGLTFSL